MRISDWSSDVCSSDLELAGDRENTLYLPAACRFLEREKAEEGPYRRQPEVAGLGSDCPARFEVVEKSDDEGGIEIGEIEVRRRLPKPALSKEIGRAHV